MSDYACDQVKEAINLLKAAVKSCDQKEIARLVEAAAKILKDLYGPIKDDFYYGNMICKELYVEIRTLRESVIELLIGHQEHACEENCFCNDGCDRDREAQGILSILQDAGGHIDCCDDDEVCCNLDEVGALLNEALNNILKIRHLLCSCCSYDSCNINSCSKDGCDDDSCNDDCNDDCNDCDDDSCSRGCDNSSDCSSSSSCSDCSSSSSCSKCSSSASCDDCSSSSSSCGSCDSSSSACSKC